jgi:hypothetical protein
MPKKDIFMQRQLFVNDTPDKQGRVFVLGKPFG